MTYPAYSERQIWTKHLGLLWISSSSARHNDVSFRTKRKAREDKRKLERPEKGEECSRGLSKEERWKEAEWREM